MSITYLLPFCSPTELTAFSDRYEDFKKLDAEVWAWLAIAPCLWNTWP